MIGAKRLLCHVRRHAQSSHALHPVNRTVAVVAVVVAVRAAAVDVHKEVVVQAVVVPKAAVVQAAVVPKAAVVQAAVVLAVAHQLVGRAQRRLVHADAIVNHFEGRAEQPAFFLCL